MIVQYVRKAPPGVEVEDVLSEVLVLLLQRRQPLPRDADGFPTGPLAFVLGRYALATIARKHARHNHRYTVCDALHFGNEPSAIGGSPEDNASESQLIERLAQACSTMTNNQQRVVFLRLNQLLSLREIGCRLNCSPATAMRYWHSARLHLLNSMKLDYSPTARLSSTESRFRVASNGILW